MVRAKPVYILGAGINQCVSDLEGLKRPLAKNFFNIILGGRRFTRSPYKEKLRPVFDYVQRHWHLEIEELRDRPFDIEELFTLVERQLLNDGDDAVDAAIVHYELNAIFAECMEHFSGFGGASKVMRSFAERLHSEQPTIITFNYDGVLEGALEATSGLREDAEIDGIPAYGPFRWDRVRAYCVPFTQLDLQLSGLNTTVSWADYATIKGSFVSNLRLLKLHGSVNWLRYLPIHSFRRGEKLQLPHQLRGSVVLAQRSWSDQPRFRNGWMLSPVIITPVLYKDEFYRWPIFSRLWKDASEQLSQSQTVIVIGYSFPQTDTSIRHVLTEALANRQVSELVIVNPDVHAVETTKALIPCKGSVRVLESLDELLHDSAVIET